MIRGAWRGSPESQAQAQGVLGAGGGAQATQAYTYRQRGFSLLPAGAGGPWLPLCTMDGTWL